MLTAQATKLSTSTPHPNASPSSREAWISRFAASTSNQDNPLQPYELKITKSEIATDGVTTDTYALTKDAQGQTNEEDVYDPGNWALIGLPLADDQVSPADVIGRDQPTAS